MGSYGLIAFSITHKCWCSNLKAAVSDAAGGWIIGRNAIIGEGRGILTVYREFGRRTVDACRWILSLQFIAEEALNYHRLRRRGSQRPRMKWRRWPCSTASAAPEFTLHDSSRKEAQSGGRSQLLNLRLGFLFVWGFFLHKNASESTKIDAANPFLKLGITNP